MAEPYYSDNKSRSSENKPGYSIGKERGKEMLTN